MTFLNDTKPSLDDVIEHHGVKGQKWGVRRNRAGNDVVRTSKPTNEEIRSARDTVRSQNKAIKSQKQLVKNGSDWQKKAATKKLTALKTEQLNHPDTATALRMTTGEKWVFGTAAVVVPFAGLGVGAGTAIRVGARHRIERDQAIARR